MENCAVLIENGVISDVFSKKRFDQKRFSSDVAILDVQGTYIAPGFIDTHIHGIGGYGTDDASKDSLLEMSRLLAQCGVTSFHPTLYPEEAEKMLETVFELSSAIGKEDGAHIMGLHLEGPFLSQEILGVMKSETVMSVDMQYMEKLWNLSGGRIINMTVAPEIKGMRELALYAVKKGIVLQAGHTNANYDQMVEGMQSGILHATHLFNAMSKMDHRNPNAVGAILIHPEMSCEIIADKHHIHPVLFKLIMRDKPIDKIVLISDALKCAEQTAEHFFANGEEVILSDGVFFRKSDGKIAGSAVTIPQALKNLTMFGCTLENAIKTATSNPAQIMHHTKKGFIIPGKDADIVVFDKNFKILAVIVGGVIKKNVFN